MGLLKVRVNSKAINELSVISNSDFSIDSKLDSLLSKVKFGLFIKFSLIFKITLIDLLKCSGWGLKITLKPSLSKISIILKLYSSNKLLML